MKSSYTKRALAFWLAVAMVATSAPMAFAREPDSVPPASTTTSGTTVTAAEQITIDHIGLAESGKVTVDGSSEKIVQATAYSSSDNATQIDNSKLTWSISGPDSSVTISNGSGTEGKITIPKNAKNGSYTVTATTKDDVATGAAKTATLTVERKAAEATTVEKVFVDGVDVTGKQITIPAGETRTLSATFLDQYGEEFKGSAQAQHSGSGTGITIENSQVKLTDAAEGTATITAKCNDSDTGKTFTVQAEKKQDQTITVKIKGVNEKITYGTTYTPDVDVTGDSDGTTKYTYVKVEKGATLLNNAVETETKPTDVGTYRVTATYTSKDTQKKAYDTFEFEIVPKELTVSGLSATQRVYTKGSKDVEITGGQLNGIVDSDDVSIAQVTGTMADDNAGVNKPVTVAVTLKGSKADNYTVKAPTDVKVNITKAKYTADGVSDNALAIEVNANKGNTVYGAIPNAMAQLKTAYAVQSATDANSILKDTPVVSGDSIKVAVKDTAAVGQSASIPVKVSFQNYEDVTITYTIKVVNKTDVSNSITFNSKTVTANGQAQSLEPAKINGYTGGTWTYAVVDSKTSTLSNAMPTFTQPGTYTVRATWEDGTHIGSKEATLTIKSAESSNITIYSVAQLSSRYDDNYSYFNVRLRDEKNGYARVRADANDYLVNQKKDGTSSEWIGMTIEPKVGSTRTTDGLWIAFSKTGTWYKLKDIGSKRSGDLYITDVDSDSFDLWFDTDDRDRTDSIYLATNSAGTENLFELEVDFNSYSGSSSSSSGSSSSDTSKVDGDRVSTTTVDKTPSVKNGSATVTFSSSALSDALDENKKEAKREDADKTYIELDVKTSKSVDDTTITVPRSSLDKLADEDTGLKLTTNQGTVTFDYRALAEIYDACDKTNIEFYLEEEDDDQYVLLIKDGSSDVIDLGRGSVEVTFDYKLKSGEKSSDVKVYRIGNGDKTWLSTYGGSTVYGAADVYAAAPTYVTDMKADYSSSKKKVTFTTDALGTFLITTDTLKTGSGSTTTTPTYNAFVDVPSSRWSATYINKLASLGIINGTGGGYFEPTLYVTREEFVKMLAGVAGANVTGYTSSRFPDVPLSRWSAPYIAWAADRGITTGTDGGNFAPTMRITREEMATMIYRYVQSSGKTLPAKNASVIFADANLISGWAQTPVSVMQQAGIIDGNVTNGRYTFDPKVSASREECAKMLAVLYDLVR